MQKFKYLLVLSLITLSTTNAFAKSKLELDRDVKATIDKCYAEVKGCKELADKSAGLLVFPEVTKGGIGVGFESGKGALIEQGINTGYYQTNAGSLGATLGVTTKSMIVALKTPEELKRFKNSSGWEVGADAGVAMLNAGASGTVDTNTIRESVVGILFNESGVIADASIKGAKISQLQAKDLG